MAGKAAELTVHSFISFNGPNGDYKRWEDCTEEEIRLFREKAGEKISKVFNDICAQRLAEGKNLDF